MEIHDTNVEVLYDFEYSTKDGQKVTIKEGEKLLLIKKTNNDWWQVIRSTGRRPFYVPSTYVKVLEGTTSKDKVVVDVGKKDDIKLPLSPVNPPHNFTVSVNIKPGPGEPNMKKKNSSKTKVMLNCDSDNEVLSGDKVSDRYGHTPTPDYSQVQMPKQKNDTLAEANILDDNLSGSLAEMAKEIKFEPSKGRTPERLKYSGSFKTPFERKLLIRSFSGSTPDLIAVDNEEKDERDVGRIKSVEELKSDQENNIMVKGIKPIINIKSMGDIAEKLEKNMARFLNSNMSMSYVENNNLKDSTDSVESGRASCETGGASSSDSIELKPKIPVAKPRKSIKPKEEVIYANFQELMRGESPQAKVSDIPSGWSAQQDSETQLTCYVHAATGDKWHSASDARSGRMYYFRENSSESSWTLPAHQPKDQQQAQAPSPEPPHPQMSEEMTAIFNKISSIEMSARKMRNAKAFSLMIPNKKEENEMTSSLRGWPELSDGRMPVVCEGPLHYTKICEGGKRARKSWTSVYVVLNQLFLLIYKDIKAFHSFKGPPEVTLDLNGAEVSSGEKVSGRKHVLLVSTQEDIGHKVALQCETINSVLHWARNIQQTINNLPKASEVVKNSKLNMISEDPSPEDARKATNILRSMSVNFKNKDDSMEDLGVNSAERQVKIKARLKKFFHKRPTMESLVKKGIWKDEAVFGSHLDQACSPNTNPRVPPFVQKCIAVIESSPENMKTDGLYRASGNLSQIQKIRLQIDQHNYSVLEREEDVHVLTGALKLFFRELKEPLIPYKLFTKAIKASTTQNKKERIHMFQDIVKNLPTSNKDTLKFLLQHLLRVTQAQEFNRMHVANVAIVFGPTLMWPEQESSNMALDLMQQNMVIEALLNDYQAIFK